VAGDTDSDRCVDVAGQRVAGRVEGEGPGDDLGDVLGLVAVVDVLAIEVGEVGGRGR
jgi:hypothetical protein